MWADVLAGIFFVAIAAVLVWALFLRQRFDAPDPANSIFDGPGSVLISRHSDYHGLHGDGGGHHGDFGGGHDGGHH